MSRCCCCGGRFRNPGWRRRASACCPGESPRCAAHHAGRCSWLRPAAGPGIRPGRAGCMDCMGDRYGFCGGGRYWLRIDGWGRIWGRSAGRAKPPRCPPRSCRWPQQTAVAANSKANSPVRTSRQPQLPELFPLRFAIITYAHTPRPEPMPNQQINTTNSNT